MSNLWIQGGSRSGKSDRAVEEFCFWAETELAFDRNPQAASQSVLVLSIDAEQRQLLSDRFSQATQGKYPVTAATPISFFRDQVLLFWPLLVRLLKFKAQFPIMLRVENEQEIASEVWAEAIRSGALRMEGVGIDRLVRRLLDLFLLAANAGKSIQDVPEILGRGIVGMKESGELLPAIATALTDWRTYCWEHGLLTYGIITELFGRYLLPNPYYQTKLKQRYRYVIADDVDEFPAIARHLCTTLLDGGAKGVFSFNPQGSARLGLGADPDYWSEISARCELVNLPPVTGTLGEQATTNVLNLALDVSDLGNFSFDRNEPIAGFGSIETISRAKLLRSVADIISDSIDSGKIQSHEIAIIVPGLDNIASYSLSEILRKKNISALPLHVQRPLSEFAQVRALLTLLALVYPHLGNLLSRDRVAEMLVVLSSSIDPVRAGILADHCFAPHQDRPKLLASETYSQWNRLGFEVSEAYEKLRQWIEQQPQNLTPLLLLDRAIQKFLPPGSLSFDRLAALQELIETAQHYWQVSYRLDRPDAEIVGRFIHLIGQGIVTANPYPPRDLAANSPDRSVTLANIYQYRMARGHHRWQFWFDASSPLWQSGGTTALFAAPLFLQNWNGQTWTIQDENLADQKRLEHLLRDLLDRTDEMVFLCYSELGTNGQLQTGPLLPLTEISTPYAMLELELQKFFESK